jgi:hypothetical protein
MLYHFIFSERRQLLHRYKTKNNYLIRINGWSSHINFAQNDPLKTFIIYGFPFLLCIFYNNSNFSDIGNKKFWSQFNIDEFDLKNLVSIISGKRTNQIWATQF